MHSLALKSDGSIVSWGYDKYNQVTDTPSDTGFVAIAAGSYHSLALKRDGSLISWGGDSYGQVSGTPAGTSFIAICCGSRHSLALKSDGSLVSWGTDSDDQVSDTPSDTGFVLIDGKWDHSLALKSDGSLVGWGDDVYGPVADTPSGTNYVAIACGGHHALALKSDGSLVSWGADSYGQVSDTPSGMVFAGHPGVSPNTGLVWGGTEVMISGSNLGNGTDITNVTLCGVTATMISQTTNSVTVISGPGTAGVGDVTVQSTSYGTTTKVNGFEYLRADQMIDFPGIGTQTVLDTVGLSATAESGGPVTFSAAVPGLIDGETNLSFTAAGRVKVIASQSGDRYWNPVTATNWVNVVGIVTNATPNIGTIYGGTKVVVDGLWLGDGTDITNVTLCGARATIVSQSVHHVTVWSGATNTAVELSGDVVVQSGFGTMVLTNGYTYRPGLEAPAAVTLGPLVLNPQNGLYEQVVTVENPAEIAARAVVLRVSGLAPHETLYNVTDGANEVHWNGLLGAGESMDFTLQYYTPLRGSVPSPVVTASLSFEASETDVQGRTFNVSGEYRNLNDGTSYLIEFEATPGLLYYIQYTDDLSNPWKTVLPGIVAPANRIQWIDSGPPSTECPPGDTPSRFYRIIEAN
jgi:hypothetical protein